MKRESREGEGPFPCRGCGLILSREKFSLSRGKSARSRCKTCTAADDRAARVRKQADKPLTDSKRGLALHDYAFARDVLGWSKTRAVAWLAQGYGYRDINSVYAMGLDGYTPYFESLEEVTVA